MRNADQNYTQQKHTIPAETVYKVTVTFQPDTWYLVPLTALPDPVYISPSVEFDVKSVGIPIQGSNPSTLPAVGSNVLYLYNTASTDVVFSITASHGYAPPVTSTPTVISEQGVTGVWQTLTDGANIDWDLALGNADVTLGGNRTLNNPTNAEAGQQYFLIVKQDSTGNRHITWGTDYHFAGGAPPDLSFNPDEWDLLEFMCDDNGYLHLQRITKNMSNEFSPISMGNLWAWLKADSFSGISDGDPVALWEDQSGNNERCVDQRH